LVLARLNLLIHHCYALQTFLAVLTLSSLQAQAEFKKKMEECKKENIKRKKHYTQPAGRSEGKESAGGEK